MAFGTLERTQQTRGAQVRRTRRLAPKLLGLGIVVTALLAFAALPGSPVRRLAHDWMNEQCMAAPQTHGVVALGDSLTVMNSDPSWNFLSDDSWFALAACQHKVRYGYDAGIVGNTTAQMLDRFTTDVSNHEPSEVVILGGTNDALRHVPTAVTMRNLQALISRSKALHARVLIGTIPPIDYQPDEPWVERINSGIRRLAKANHIGLIDFHAALAVGTHYRKGWTVEGIHPDHAGAIAMEQAFLRAQKQ